MVQGCPCLAVTLTSSEEETKGLHLRPWGFNERTPFPGYAHRRTHAHLYTPIHNHSYTLIVTQPHTHLHTCLHTCSHIQSHNSYIHTHSYTPITSCTPITIIHIDIHMPTHPHYYTGLNTQWHSVTHSNIHIHTHIHTCLHTQSHNSHTHTWAVIREREVGKSLPPPGAQNNWEFVGERAGLSGRSHCVLPLESMAYLTSAGKPSVPLRFAHLCSPSARPLLYALGHCEWNHDWAMGIARAKQSDLKLKEK